MFNLKKYFKNFIKNFSLRNSIELVETTYSKNSKVNVLPRHLHGISRKLISSAALKVLYGLKKAGFSAYLVGGGVRDLLLGLEPKDFDISTNAHPEQVYKLFRNSRLIGRRFKLVHIYYGSEIIEVSTFRAGSTEIQSSTHSKEGMIIRDNFYGTIEEDVMRRDFTINALYYNIYDFSLVDFTAGLHHLKQKIIQVIGDPFTRYREDPVRMLRAIRLAEKLNFDIESSSEEALFKLAPMIGQVSEARLFEECSKLFLKGYAEKTFYALKKYGIAQVLFPLLMEELDQPCFAQLVHRVLVSTDERVKQNKMVSPTFFYAALLWPNIVKAGQIWFSLGHDAYTACELAMNQVIQKQQLTLAIPRRINLVMRDIWRFQSRFKTHRIKKAMQLAAHPRFRAAYDLLLLRAAIDEPDAKALSQWWTEFILASPEQKLSKMAQLKKLNLSEKKSKPKLKSKLQLKSENKLQ